MKTCVKALMLAMCASAALFANGNQEAAPSADTPVTVTMWESSEQSHKFMVSDILPRFYEKYPNIKIETQYIPIQDFVKRLSVALPAGDTPDLLVIEDSWATAYLTAGYFEKNTPELDAMVKEMNPAFGPSVTWNGASYGVPYHPFHSMMYYNLDMLESIGYKDGATPETWDEVLDAAQKLTKRDANGDITVSGFSMRLGGNPSGTAQKWWVNALLPRGVNIYEESKTQPGKFHCGFDNEAGYEALKMYIDYLYKYKVDDFKSMKDTEAFAQQRTAMNVREETAGLAIKANAPDFTHWVAKPMPKGPSKWATYVASQAFYIPTAAKHKDAARTFVKFACSKDISNVKTAGMSMMSQYLDADYSTIDPRMQPAFNFEGMDVANIPIQNAYDTVMIRIGDWISKVVTRADLLDNPEGIKEEIHAIAKVVNDTYDEYAE